jgi:hypothetical protein
LGPLNASGPHGSGLPWSSARLAPASEELARESRERLIAAIAPG